MIDIAVIGAGPAGYSAAITARKRDQSVVVIGQNTGSPARSTSPTIPACPISPGATC